MNKDTCFSQWKEIPEYDMGPPFYEEGIKWTSRNNFELEDEAHHISKCVIHDVTLRDGDQTPGSVFLEDERVRIADALADLKVARIEAGMPVVSKIVENAMRRMTAKRYPHSKIYGFARAMRKDVELCLDIGCDGIIVEYCVNPLYIKYAYKKEPIEVMENLIDAINLAKSKDLDVAFMGWDWFRAPIEFTKSIVQELYEKTAIDGLVIVDTYGSTTPDTVEAMCRKFHNWFPRLRLEFHGHCDNGCGVANCLAALWGGAEVIHTAVNGMGERCGNVPTEEVIATLGIHKGVPLDEDFSKIAPLCEVVSKISGIPISGNKPVMGGRQVQIESGVAMDIEYKMTHLEGVYFTNTYNTITPSVFGRTDKIHPVLGKNSGKSSIKLVLEKYNISASAEEIDTLLEMVKNESYVTKGCVSEGMFLKFVNEVKK